MANKLYFPAQHITASTVVARGKGAILHTITINTAAATAGIQVFDDTTTTSPANPITGIITAPAGGYTTPVTLIFDCVVANGVTIMITTAAADITVTAA